MQKFLKPLLIGELAPGEPSQDRDKNVSISSELGFIVGILHHFFPLSGCSPRCGKNIRQIVKVSSVQAAAEKEKAAEHLCAAMCVDKNVRGS